MSFDSELQVGAVVPAVWDVLSGGAAIAAGSSHLFVSGGALSASLGYPDTGVLDIEELLGCLRRMKSALPGIPLLVDIETGYGAEQRLARLCDGLVSLGVEGVMIEDQVTTGQSVDPDSPGLCDPEIMCRRVEIIRAIAGERMQILARTDRVPGIALDESLDRLETYSAAGADWVMPVFLGSHDELEAASKRFDEHLFVIVVKGRGGYVPDQVEIDSVRARAVLVTSQNRNAFTALQDAYHLSLTGQWEALREGQASASTIASVLSLGRFEGDVT